MSRIQINGGNDNMVVSCNLIRLIRNLLDDDAGLVERTDGAAVSGHAENSSE